MFPTLLILVVGLTSAVVGAPADANTSHAGWPAITGMLLMNKQDQDRPLDGRPGADPFDGADPFYSCDGLHLSTSCVATDDAMAFAPQWLRCEVLPILPALKAGNLRSWLNSTCSSTTTSTVPANIGHNELLGGHGSDVIHAGPAGDVLWGDSKDSGQPTTQTDVLVGNTGDDFIYASHGRNLIRTGGGTDVVHAHFGRGIIRCSSPTVTVFISRVSRKRYSLRGCTHVSYKTLGY